MALLEKRILAKGPLVEVRVGLSAKHRQLLYVASRPVPPPVHGQFIIDTGADTTMVDDQTIRALGLTDDDAIDQTEVITSESKGKGELCNVFDIELEVINPGRDSWVIKPLQVIARPLMTESPSGMLARDALTLAVMIYDGPRGSFQIQYEPAPTSKDRSLPG